MAHYYSTGSAPGGSVVMSEPVVHVGGYSDPYYASPSILGAATGTSATYVEPYLEGAVGVGRYVGDPVVGGTYYSGAVAPTYLPHQVDSMSAYPASVSDRSYGHYPHELNRRVLPTTRKRTVRVTEYLVDDMGHQELVSQNVNPDAAWEGSGGIPRDARMVGEDLYLVEAKASKKQAKRGPSSPRSPRPRARSPRPTPRSGSAPSSPRFHSSSRLSPSPYRKPTKAKKKKPAARAWH